MKQILIFPIVLFGAFISHSQTYISPVIGVDIMKVIIPSESKIFLKKNGYPTISPTLGIKVEKKISDILSVSCESNYTVKSADAYFDICSIHPEDKLKFTYIRNNLSLNYFENKYIKIGFGYDYNFVKPTTFHLQTSKNPMRYEQGISARMGTQWRNFELMAYFHKSLAFMNDGPKSSFNLNSFGITTGYKFKMFKGKK